VSETDLGPLPAGRHHLGRAQVAHSQRERLIAGFAQAVVEHGYHSVTITHITKAASVSRRAFYQQFQGKEDCFLAAFDVVVEYARTLVLEAIEPIEDWPQRVIVAMRVILRFFSSEPDLAHLCFVDSLSAGEVVANRFRETVQSVGPLLQPGRRQRPGKRSLPASTEDSLVGAVASLISRKIVAGEAELLEDLTPSVVEFLLTPYLGSERAYSLAHGGTS
jgi:AcrR family transcriptional regulator